MSGPAATGEHEEEEMAALVPRPPPSPMKDGDLQCNDGGSTESTEHGISKVKPPSSWTWGRVVPTRGIGLVMGGLFVLSMLVGSTSSNWWSQLDSSTFQLGTSVSGAARHGGHGRPPHHHTPSSAALRVPIPFNCINETSSTCRRAATSPSPSPSSSPSVPLPLAPSSTCPEYFRHIHKDLSPWRETGITRQAVERARHWAFFRLVVVDGRAYVVKYRRAFQTRDVFTQWGILQLLARYPGRVPDLDIMFFCGDIPQVRAAGFPNPSTAPPLFGYCKDGAEALDILFPDWTFWGWPEVNIRPWAPFLEEVMPENQRVPWPEREPYAYWKGNPTAGGEVRGDLMRCNASDGGKDWNARLFGQDWRYAIRNDFKDSNLAKQCLYRYKIYVQGRGWSVSRKYILACDSLMLPIDSPYQDFFSRGLVAGRHYWPIDNTRKCPSIKFAVDWGNAHPAQAQRMGEEGSSFAREEMSMDYVYDYMLHLLTNYARLLRYKPTVPGNAVELCLESMACPESGRSREFLLESRERYVADYEPCTLPPPFTADEVKEMVRRDEEVRSKVKRMEEEEEKKT
ncbi:uncharacterized protein LOC133900672 [Phragmites australis]|uniref:uncharacterized protein LOC133900672 n=1 Tax=Phragmites australis TaxID=29695 RepID=UPI002D775EB8|nr:uncharacterized protein LOC133900672 [Phragmites australis]